MGRRAAIIFLSLIQPLVMAQALTIEKCYDEVHKNYPLIRQLEITKALSEFSIANIHHGYYPQVNISGQASYQSAVTVVPIDVPNFPIKPLAKDQYKLTADFNQNLFDGGTIKKSTSLQEKTLLAEQQQVEIEMFKLRERINQIFFGILLADKQLDQLSIVKKDLEGALQKVNAAVQNGAALRMNSELLKAEVIRTSQRSVELKSLRSAYLQTLNVLTGNIYPDQIKLFDPEPMTLSSSMDIVRPELIFFDLQKEQVLAQHQVSLARTLPRANLFLQTGYGRPALNFLLNRFDTWYIGGVRFNWNLSGFYNQKTDRQITELNLKSIENRRDLFVMNTNIQVKQYESELDKLNELIRLDDELIQLRASIRKTANAQLENGIITANDFLKEFNAEDQARLNLLFHRTQLALVQHNLKATLGEP